MKISIALGGTVTGRADVASPSKKSGSRCAAQRQALPGNLAVEHANRRIQKSENRKVLIDNVAVFEAFWLALQDGALWPKYYEGQNGLRMIDKIKQWNSRRRQQLTKSGSMQ